MDQKLKNRVALAAKFGQMGFERGAEIGTCYGHFAVKLYDNVPHLQLFCIDNWDNAETRHRNAKRPGHDVEVECRKRLYPYGAVVMKGSSTDMAELIADNSLDFVYIDAAHDYDNVKADINAWAPKVKKGGIVSGDDYYPFPSGSTGVVDAVNEYAKDNNIDLQVTAWDNDNPERDERQPAWWYIK